MEKKRIDYIDFIKGISIFFVVWGHTIQNIGAENAFWTNPFHIVICTFHMPLFMILSGFFFSIPSTKNLLSLTKKKFRQLIIPCFGWSIVLVLLTTCYMIVDKEPISLVERIKTLFYETGTRFWFLRSVFICYLGAAVSIRIFRKDTVACLISILIMLLLTDNFRLSMDKFMYPFFWIGYFLHKHLSFLSTHKYKLILTSLILYIILIVYWHTKYYIYITGMSFYEIVNGKILFFPFLERLEVVLYRYAIGILGSICLFFTLQSVYTSSFQSIKNIGKYTLGIYVIHIFIEGNLLNRFDISGTGFWVFNLVLTPLISLILIYICIGIIKVIQKNRFTNTLFLGNEFQTKQKTHN